MEITVLDGLCFMLVAAALIFFLLWSANRGG